MDKIVLFECAKHSNVVQIYALIRLQVLLRSSRQFSEIIGNNRKIKLEGTSG